MKKLLYIILFLAGIYTNAQTIAQQNNATYTQEATVALKPLIQKDAYLYKNSILYDRVMPLANLSEFNNTNNSLTHSDHFIRAWQELYNARITKTNKQLSVDDLKAIANHYQQKGIIQLGIINTDFTQLKENTVKKIQDKKLTIPQLAKRNEIAARGGKKIEYPYENKHLFMVSPILNGAIQTTPNANVSFQIGQLGINQTSKKIKTLHVIHNRKTITLIQNSRVLKPQFTLRFNRKGIQNIQFKATFTNGKTLLHNAKFKVTFKSAAKTPATKLIKATEPFRGYDEPANCNGDCYGRGEYQIFFGKNNTKLKKPLIILDGFDPGDKRKINSDEKPITYLINNSDKEQNLQKFKNAGFDVVILNFPKYEITSQTIRYWHPFLNRHVSVTIKTERDGGSDYIERNANVLKALIVKLNKELKQNGSNEKLKIIGPSMGGLISRVALTQMEKANQNHNTDIWVSFDSPHLGANIPIGLQYFFNFMELDQIKDLKTPAAKQMLITQVVDQSYTTRNRFKNLLNNLGFPQKTRNIALINGSINGKRAGTPRGKMLQVDFRGLRTPFGSTFRYQINTYASHDGGRHKIFERYKRILLFKNRHNAYLIDNSGKGSLDNSPGGYFDMKNEFESSLGVKLPLTNFNAGSAVNKLLDVTDQPAKFGVRIITPILLHTLNSSIYLNLYQGKPSFIPTKSSLAFKGSNKILHEDLSNRNLVCTGETPFDNYFAPKENEEHITLNAKNMSWLLKEIKEEKQQPTSPHLNSNDLLGPISMCPNTTKTYRFKNCKQPYNFKWSVSSNLQIISQNKKNITIKAKRNGLGFIKITTPKYSFVKSIWVGKPTIVTQLEPTAANYVDVHLVGSNNSNIREQGITNVKWEIISREGGCYANFWGSGFGGSGNGNCTSWRVYVKITATNSCGSTTIYTSVTPPPPSPCENNSSYNNDYSFRRIIEDPCMNKRSSSDSDISENNTENTTENNVITMFPNPAKNQITIHSKSATINRVKITNGSGVTLIEESATSNTKTLQINQLPIGVYYAVVYFKDQHKILPLIKK